jgi:hypothetical protein
MNQQKKTRTQAFVGASNLVKWNVVNTGPGALDDCQTACEDKVAVRGTDHLLPFGSAVQLMR